LEKKTKEDELNKIKNLEKIIESVLPEKEKKDSANNFWENKYDDLKETTQALKKPSEKIMDPEVSKPIKLKELINVNFSLIKNNKDDSKEKYQCPCCSKGIFIFNTFLKVFHNP
jgi:RecG-like helicase